MPKQPYFIHRSDGRPFGFAALAETWIGPYGEEMDTVAIVTAASEGDMTALHARVPVALERDDFAQWLNCVNDDTDQALTLLRAPAAGTFVWFAVSTRVNKVANDDAQLLLPIAADDVAQPPARKPVRIARKAEAPPSDGQGSLF